MRLKVIFAAAIAVALVPLACGGDGTGPDECGKGACPVITVTLTPGAATLVSIGETTTLTPGAQDENGDVIRVSLLTFTWSSDNPSVADVDGNGVVTAKANGSATISAATSGAGTSTVTGAAGITVQQTAVSVVVDPPSAGVFPGDSVLLTATGKDANDNPVPGASFSWGSSSSGLARVDAGWVFGVSAGGVEITATSGTASGMADVQVWESGSMAALDIFEDPLTEALVAALPTSAETAVQQAIDAVFQGFEDGDSTAIKTALSAIETALGAVTGADVPTAAVLGLIVDHVQELQTGGFLAALMRERARVANGRVTPESR